MPAYTNIDDLIGNPPGWLLRSGLTVLALVVTVVLIMSAFIRYPDKITSTGIMTSTTPPLRHKAKTAGLVDSIYVDTDQKVKAGDTLLYIQNHATLKDIQQLATFVESFKQAKDLYDYAYLHFPEGS